ncbi:MAG TPA: hypothetical protein VEJ00_15760 [Candidatus Acidoferrales bacterium]|nr:hypothetical protein [Candidatus Acidoferrales bacterium]
MSSKFWLRLGVSTVLSLALSGAIAVAQDHDRDDDRWHDHGRDHERDHDRDRDHDRNFDHDRGHHEGYVDHDRDIRGWYRAHYDHLPPGLAKRDRLPPGLERRLVVNGFLTDDLRRRMQPCPHALEVMLPPPAPGFAHVFIGGNLVLVNRANFQVVDVFHFNLN